MLTFASPQIDAFQSLSTPDFQPPAYVERLPDADSIAPDKQLEFVRHAGPIGTEPWSSITFHSETQQRLELSVADSPRVLDWVLFGIQSSQELEQTTSRVVAALLRDVASRVPSTSDMPPELRTSDRERALVGVLEYASSSDRSAFVGLLLSAAENNPHAAKFLISKIDNVMYFLNAEEQAELFDRVFASTEPALQDFAPTVLRGCDSLSELAALVEHAGPGRLLASSNQELRELAAIALLYREARSDLLPPLGEELPDAAGIVSEIDALERFLQRRESSRSARPEFSTTETSVELGAIYQQNLGALANLRAELECAEGEGELFRIQTELHLVRDRMELELKYGLLLTGEQDSSGAELPRWERDELAQIKSALERLPEGVLLTTPGLCEVRRVRFLGAHTLGLRQSDGVIKIADLAVNNALVARIYPRASSLERTLVHEIGHAFQIGRGGGGISVNADFRFCIESGDDRYDFLEYAALSGWRVVDPSRFSVADDGLSVVVDGVPCPLGAPVEVNGRTVVYEPVGGLLFEHEAAAHFSLVPYSRTNPWEDWAEAFAEYFTIPERLIAFAPDKYVFMEEEFRHYHQNAEISAKLAARLRGGASMSLAAHPEK